MTNHTKLRFLKPHHAKHPQGSNSLSKMKILLLPSLILSAVHYIQDELAPTGQIKHFVVLVLENRSFDSFLGNLKQSDPLVDGIDFGGNAPLRKRY
jgi:phospholipase C